MSPLFFPPDYGGSPPISAPEPSDSSGSWSSDAASWLSTLNGIGLGWYKTLNPPSPLAVKATGIPGSAGSLAPASTTGDWLKKNGLGLAVLAAIGLAIGFGIRRARK